MKLKFCAVLLAAALAALCLTGCKTKSYDTVLTVDGTPVGPGLYRLFQIQAYSEAAQSVENSDRLFSQKIAGKSAMDFISERTLELLRTYFYYETEFAAAKLAFTETEQAENKTRVAADWAEVSPVYERNGVSQADFYAYDQNSLKAQKLFLKAYASVTDEQVRVFLDKNFARMNYVQLPLVTSTGASLSAEETAAIDEAVKSALRKIAAGESFSDTVADLVSECYAKAGFTVTGSGSAYIRTSYLNLATESDKASESLAAAVAGTKVGECGSFQAAGYYYVLFRRQENFQSQEDFQALRPSVLYQMKGAEFTAAMQAECDQYHIVLDEAAVSFYSPKKLELSFGTLNSASSRAE